MLSKRIIACLDVKDGQTVKGVRFQSLRQAGNPVELAKIYADFGVDELVFLDISATLEGRSTFLKVVEEVAQVLNIPFCVGGGVRCVEDARALLRAGADKVSVNSAAVRNPQIISQLAKSFGSQCVVVAIDSKNIAGEDTVFTHAGNLQTTWNTLAWAKEATFRGAGEVLLTSMDADGTKRGFDCRLTKRLADELPVPVIASGGAGAMEHFSQVFQEGADAALAASIFHFKEIAIPELKAFLSRQGIAIRNEYLKERVYAA